MHIFNCHSIEQESSGIASNPGAYQLQTADISTILRMLWNIIYHFQIEKCFFLDDAKQFGAKSGSAQHLLMDWVRSLIPEYGVKNFTRYGSMAYPNEYCIKCSLGIPHVIQYFLQRLDRWQSIMCTGQCTGW